MTFSAPFSRVFRPAFGPGLAAASSAWWLSGGIAAGSAVAVYQPKGAASLAASYVNLANPGTHDAAPGVAPTWASGTGWTFNGSSQYLTTGVVPANGATMIVRFVAIDGPIVGHISGSLAQWFAIRWITEILPNCYRFYPGASVDYNTDTAQGVAAVAGGLCFFDGVQVGNSGGSGVSGSTAQIHVGRYYGVETRYFTGSIQAVAIYNTTLTAPQVAAVSAAMAAL